MICSTRSYFQLYNKLYSGLSLSAGRRDRGQCLHLERKLHLGRTSNIEFTWVFVYLILYNNNKIINQQTTDVNTNAAVVNTQNQFTEILY